ncbi:cyclic nucleotide-gated cation channel beta-1-like [Protopterus annectens]|uniref:cyclic nucleotide-gated cation channel beta-1-like n=1 Tax=Protopterus annectens TaxID=7888 RepID=UPI001CFA5E9D|nr:cyclic nucleotide-gated cation channel beta-1-like [Protopterus annectens]
MFSWIVKVVPQPPNPQQTTSVEEKGEQQPESIPQAAVPTPRIPEPEKQPTKCEEQPMTTAGDEKKEFIRVSSEVPAEPPKVPESTTEKSSSEMVFTWLAHGFSKMMPQPTDSPKTSRASILMPVASSTSSDQVNTILMILHI